MFLQVLYEIQYGKMKSYSNGIDSIVPNWMNEYFKIKMKEENIQLTYEAIQELKTSGMIVKDATQSEDVFQLLTQRGKEIVEIDLKNKEDTIIRLNKLQTVFAGKTSTLEDVEKYVQKTCHDEIQREANKKFSVEKEQLTANLLNQLLKLPREEMGEALQKRLSVDIQNGVNTTLKIFIMLK